MAEGWSSPEYFVFLYPSIKITFDDTGIDGFETFPIVVIYTMADVCNIVKTNRFVFRDLIELVHDAPQCAAFNVNPYRFHLPSW